MMPRTYEGTGEFYTPEIAREIARSRTWPTASEDIVPLAGSAFYKRVKVRVRKYRVKVIEATGKMDILLLREVK